MQVHAALVAEIGGSSFILLGVLVAIVFGTAYGLYTRQGSGINKHPGPDSHDPVLDEDDEHIDERAGVDRTQSAELDQRGVK